MMEFVINNLFVIASAVFAIFVAIFVFVALRGKRDPDVKLGLHDFVTLDSSGWFTVAAFGLVGSAVMILTSAAIGIDYWVGLAIEGDVSAGRIDAEKADSFLDFWTVGTVSFFVLALIFEFFSDLGVPLASGLAQRKKPFLPKLALAATAGCIVMSLVTKWGYYDDKREFRENEVQRQVFVDTEWHNQKQRAEADLITYASAPTVAVADAQEDTAKRKIGILETQLNDIQATIDDTPETHSTNRVRLTSEKMRISNLLLEAEGEVAMAEALRSDAQKLAEARADLEEANLEIQALIGTQDEEGNTRVAAGDTVFARTLRVGLHQFLCWLFPLIWFEGRAGYIDQKRKEEANAKRRQTNEEKKNTFDASFTDVPQQPTEIEVGDEYFDEVKEREQREIDRLQEMMADAEADDRDLREQRLGEADRTVEQGYEPGDDRTKDDP
jgi:hypothetical protein